VRDDGCGIEADDLPRVFERFYRGHGVRHEGSGLGLSIVDSIAIAHGGQATVESSPGSGSLFTIVLPPPAAACDAPATEG
jgi:signal transduction histidine kinase